jgi:hypothetical protein
MCKPCASITRLPLFRGVATRYLRNTCGRRRAIDLARIDSAQVMLRSAGAVLNT